MPKEFPPSETAGREWLLQHTPEGDVESTRDPVTQDPNLAPENFPEDKMIEKIDKVEYVKWLQTFLRPRYLKVLVEREIYGKTFSEIGKLWDVTNKRAHQIHKDAIQLAKTCSDSRFLKDYFPEPKKVEDETPEEKKQNALSQGITEDELDKLADLLLE